MRGSYCSLLLQWLVGIASGIHHCGPSHASLLQYLDLMCPVQTPPPPACMSADPCKVLDANWAVLPGPLLTLACSPQGIFHFQLGRGEPMLHTRLRPHCRDFLEKIAKLYELHVFTFGSRLYAHTIAGQSSTICGPQTNRWQVVSCFQVRFLQNKEWCRSSGLRLAVAVGKLTGTIGG